MKWLAIISNVVAALSLVILGNRADCAHQANSQDVRRALQIQGLGIELPEQKGTQKFESFAVSGHYYLILAYLGATACVVNAAIGILPRKPPKQRNLSYVRC